MHILLTAATAFEIQPVIDHLRRQAGAGERSQDYQRQHPSLPSDSPRRNSFSDPEIFLVNGHSVEVLISGIGIMNTTYALTSSLYDHSADYVLQAGIGGSFSEEAPILSPLLVKEELIGDLGAAERDGFKDLFDMGFMQPDQDVYTGKWLINPHVPNWKKFNIPFVKGITINEITTSPTRVSMLQQKYQPVVESMEGAALHYVCLKKGIPFMQLRVVSNKVGERNKANWKIKEAINTLNEKLIGMLREFPQ